MTTEKETTANDQLEMLAKELGVSVEKLREKASSINKATGDYKKEQAKEKERNQDAVIEKEFNLSYQCRNAVKNLIEKHESVHGQVQRGTQFQIFFTARKDGSNSVVAKANVKEAQAARWIDQNGKWSTEEVKAYKRERKTPTSK